MNLERILVKKDELVQNTLQELYDKELQGARRAEGLRKFRLQLWREGFASDAEHSTESSTSP